MGILKIALLTSRAKEVATTSWFQPDLASFMRSLTNVELSPRYVSSSIVNPGRPGTHEVYKNYCRRVFTNLHVDSFPKRGIALPYATLNPGGRLCCSLKIKNPSPSKILRSNKLSPWPFSICAYLPSQFRHKSHINISESPQPQTTRTLRHAQGVPQLQV